MSSGKLKCWNFLNLLLVEYNSNSDKITPNPTLVFPYLENTDISVTSDYYNFVEEGIVETDILSKSSLITELSEGLAGKLIEIVGDKVVEEHEGEFTRLISESIGKALKNGPSGLNRDFKKLFSNNFRSKLSGDNCLLYKQYRINGQVTTKFGSTNRRYESETYYRVGPNIVQLCGSEVCCYETAGNQTIRSKEELEFKLERKNDLTLTVGTFGSVHSNTHKFLNRFDFKSVEVEFICKFISVPPFKSVKEIHFNCCPDDYEGSDCIYYLEFYQGKLDKVSLTLDELRDNTNILDKARLILNKKLAKSVELRLSGNSVKVNIEAPTPITYSINLKYRDSKFEKSISDLTSFLEEFDYSFATLEREIILSPYEYECFLEDDEEEDEYSEESEDLSEDLSEEYSGEHEDDLSEDEEDYESNDDPWMVNARRDFKSSSYYRFMKYFSLNQPIWKRLILQFPEDVKVNIEIIHKSSLVKSARN